MNMIEYARRASANVFYLFVSHLISDVDVAMQCDAMRCNVSRKSRAAFESNITRAHLGGGQSMVRLSPGES
jgi:hypothetical protein